MVFDEAKCLGIPTLTTNTTSAKEIIEDDQSGFVCDNSDDEIYKKLVYILNNLEELNTIKNTLLSKDFNNLTSISQFEMIL